MTFPALLTALRRRWPLLVAGLLAGLLAAFAVVVLSPKTFAATSTLYISADDTSTNAQNAYQGTLLSQQKVKSYTEIAVSRRVLQPVIDQLRLTETPSSLGGKVAVSADTQSTLLRVTVQDRSPQRAADVGNAVTARFIEVIGQLERPRVAGAAPTTTVDVVDRAVVDRSPVSPRTGLDLVVGLVLGLLLGIAAAVIRAATDTSLRTPQELEDATGGPVLGSLPLDASLRAGRPLRGAPLGPYGEGVRRVRTNLLFADVDRPPALVAVTSSATEEGKTTLVHGLAAAFATTSRVAIVEGDLRRPMLARRLGLVESVGLTDVLARRIDLSAAMQPWGDGVDVLPCGTVPHNPSELLSSEQMGDVLAQLRATYDIVLVDTPPLGPVADAALLASRCDGTLLLCRAGSTSRDKVVASADALAKVDARLLGTVLTMTPAGRPSHYDTYVPAESGTAPASGSASGSAGHGRMVGRDTADDAVRVPSGPASRA